MRIYSESSEETLRARRLLKEWANDDLVTNEQFKRLEQDLPCDLRVTNIFLRLVLFVFTLIVVAAGAGLTFTIFLSRPSQQTTGLFLLVFAAVSYAAAEVCVIKGRLYRYGIEDALAVCSVAFLCAGLDSFLFSGVSSASRGIASIVPATGLFAALWIWYRFNLWYAFPAAMIFVVFLPGYWIPSCAEQLVFIAAMYAAGLTCIAIVHSRHRFNAFAEGFSLSEAFLWLGIYLTFNLKISAVSLAMGELSHMWPALDLAGPFYWTTWVLIWCLPPLILARGVRQKDRYVLASGTLTALLTFVTNKPYLGWQRHTWDPMLLGIALTGFTLLLRRWLAQGEGGVRHGFTVARLSGKDKRLMSVGSAALGFVTPQSITPNPQPNHQDFRFGGGESGGGGAGGDF